jgi:CheY-like chemotaxis protein
MSKARGFHGARTSVMKKSGIMPIEVLLVEDNPGDVLLTRIALEDSKISVNLNVVEDGVEAMAFLRKQAKYTTAPHPDIVLLDLNLPKKDGREVLAEIKADENLKRIPVVILTTSQSEEDILKAYNLSANCYITKPVDFDQFVKIVRSIEDFWFAIVKLPPE